MNFDFLSGINALGGGVLGYLIPFLFVLTLVVFFHELGHFLIARWCACGSWCSPSGSDRNSWLQ